MPEQKQPPRPHGDPLEEEIVNNDESNPAQRQSDATGDAVSLGGVEEPTAGTTSDANGISAGDEADGVRRKKLYANGAELVSRID
jgi:hypothetical protein